MCILCLSIRWPYSFINLLDACALADCVRLGSGMSLHEAQAQNPDK